MNLAYESAVQLHTCPSQDGKSGTRAMKLDKSHETAYLHVEGDSRQALRSDDPHDGVDAPGDDSDGKQCSVVVCEVRVGLLDLGKEAHELVDDQAKEEHAQCPPRPLPRVHNGSSDEACPTSVCVRVTSDLF
jgi:hypothetical protein